MRASISADTGRGPGNGIIEIFDAGDVTDPSFTLLRASDGKCLGPRGWQESESPLAPEAWDNDGGSLRLAVGSAVVDEVDNLDAYRISLRGVGSCALSVKSLVYSHIAGGDGMGAATAAPAPQPEPQPTAPQPEPEPVLESPEPPLAFDVPSQPSPQEAPLEMASGHEGKSGGKAGIVILLVLLALAAGVAAWWFLLREPEKAPLPTPPAQSQDADKPHTPEQAQPKPADAAAQQGADAAKPQLSPLASAREQLRGQALPDVSLAMAHRRYGRAGPAAPAPSGLCAANGRVVALFDSVRKHRSALQKPGNPCPASTGRGYGCGAPWHRASACALPGNAFGWRTPARVHSRSSCARPVGGAGGRAHSRP